MTCEFQCEGTSTHLLRHFAFPNRLLTRRKCAGVKKKQTPVCPEYFFHACMKHFSVCWFNSRTPWIMWRFPKHVECNLHFFPRPKVTGFCRHFPSALVKSRDARTFERLWRLHGGSLLLMVVFARFQTGLVWSGSKWTPGTERGVLGPVWVQLPRLGLHQNGGGSWWGPFHPKPYGPQRTFWFFTLHPNT